MSSSGKKEKEKTRRGGNGAGDGGFRGGPQAQATPAAPATRAAPTASSRAAAKRGGKEITSPTNIATTGRESRRKKLGTHAVRRREATTASQQISTPPPSSKSLALNYEVARAEDDPGDIMSTERINLAFNALAKLIPHTGHLKVRPKAKK